jgi:uncharacterized protein YcfJ
MKYLVLLLPLLTACTSYSQQHRDRYQMATVTSAQPVYRTVEIHKPKRVCEERQVVKRHADSAAPTIVGAIIGGALGNAIGHNSSNKKVGMAAGAVLGGAVGHDIGQKNGTDVMHHETVCYQAGTEVEYQSVVDGYQVIYQLNGREYTTLMDRDPGPQMPVYVEPASSR